MWNNFKCIPFNSIVKLNLYSKFELSLLNEFCVIRTDLCIQSTTKIRKKGRFHHLQNINHFENKYMVIMCFKQKISVM